MQVWHNKAKYWEKHVSVIALKSWWSEALLIS